MRDAPEPDRLASGDQLLLPLTKAPPRDAGTVQGEISSIGIHDEDPVPGDEQSGAGLRPSAGPPPDTNSSVIHDDSLEASIDVL